jgi:hypothetical protein
MHQDNTLDLSSLASFESLENLLAARRRDGSTEAMMVDGQEWCKCLLFNLTENKLKCVRQGNFRYEVWERTP